MQMIEDKFTSLAATPPLDGEYAKDYFEVQIAIAKLLAHHQLYMQSYTILNEMIASLAMRYYPEKSNFSEGEKNRDIAGVFRTMILKKLEDLNFLHIQHKLLDELFHWDQSAKCPHRHAH